MGIGKRIAMRLIITGTAFNTAAWRMQEDLNLPWRLSDVASLVFLNLILILMLLIIPFPPSPVKTARTDSVDTHAASGKTKKESGG